MKASHRKDVIIARIIFAVMCIALLAAIIALVVWLHGKSAGKNPSTEITNNASAENNIDLPPVTEQPAANGQSVWTSTDGVNLRAEPNTDCKILTMLEIGTQLTLLGEENGWAQVEYDGQQGYVSADYITDVDPAGETQRQ